MCGCFEILLQTILVLIPDLSRLCTCAEVVQLCRGRRIENNRIRRRRRRKNNKNEEEEEEEEEGNKTLWERIFGRGRITRTILLTCVIAAKQLSSYPTRENKSFTLYYFFAEPHGLCSAFQSTTKYLSVHDNVLKCTSSTQTCSQPNCNKGHQCLQPVQITIIHGSEGG